MPERTQQLFTSPLAPQALWGLQLLCLPCTPPSHSMGPAASRMQECCGMWACCLRMLRVRQRDAVVECCGRMQGCCSGMQVCCSRTRDPPVLGGAISPQQSIYSAFAQGTAACPSPPASQSSQGFGAMKVLQALWFLQAASALCSSLPQ